MTLTTMSLSFIPSFYSRLTNKSIKCKTNKKKLFYPFDVVVSEAKQSFTVSGYNDNKDSSESQE